MRNLNVKIQRMTIVIPMALLVCLSGCSSLFGPPSGSSRPAGGIEQAKGAEPPEIDLVFVVDQSESMGGSPHERGTDPTGLRFRALRYAIDSLRMKATASRPHRMGLVQFGTDAPAELSSSLIATTDSTGIAHLQAKLQPRNLVWTNFGSAMKRAAGILRTGGAFAPNHRPAIVVFTDGTPEDTRHLPRSAYFQEIERLVDAELGQTGCLVYLVAVDASGRFWGQDSAEWNRITGGRARSIASVEELKPQFNEILLDLLQLPKMAKDEVHPGMTAFTVGPYLEQLECHVLGQPLQGLELVAPNGHAVQPVRWTSQDYTILTVKRPQAGAWSYRLPSKATTLTIYRNETPVRPRLVSPLPIHPAGKAMRVIAEVRYVNGDALTELPAYPLRITTRVTPGGKQASNYTMRPRGSGLFDTDGDTPIPPQSREVQVETVLHAGTSREYTTSSRIDITRTPYFDVSLQTGGWLRHYGDQIVVTAQLREAGAPVAPEQVFQSPTAVIRAELVGSPENQRSTSMWLDERREQPGTYVAYLPAAVRAPGRYEVTYALGATDVRSGKRVEGTETISVMVRPTWLDWLVVGGTLAARLAAIGLTVLIITLLWAFLWALRLPRMRGGKVQILAPERPQNPARTPANANRPKTQPSGGGLAGLMQTAAAATPAQASEGPSPAPSRDHSYPLRGKFLLCRYGRLFFIHEVRARRGSQGPLGGGARMDVRQYAVRFFVYGVPGIVRCESGKDVMVGRYRVKF